MKVVRILLAIIFTVLIVVGIWKYYAHHDEVQVDNPFAWLLEKWNTKDKVDVWISEKKDHVATIISQINQKNQEKKTDTEVSGVADEHVLHEDFSTGTLSTNELDRISQLGVVWWDSAGNILWLHYCDFDAKYCEKSFEEWIVYAYQAIEPNLQYIYKPFPPTMKADDLLAHRAALCAMDNGTAKQYFSYYYALYEKSRTRKSESKLIDLWKDIGIENMQDCMEKSSYEIVIQQETKLAKKLFGVHTLPANIFINKTTKERILVPGYYETDEVQGAIEYVR